MNIVTAEAIVPLKCKHVFSLSYKVFEQVPRLTEDFPVAIRRSLNGTLFIIGSQLKVGGRDIYKKKDKEKVRATGVPTKSGIFFFHFSCYVIVLFNQIYMSLSISFYFARRGAGRCTHSFQNTSVFKLALVFLLLSCCHGIGDCTYLNRAILVIQIVYMVVIVMYLRWKAC